MDICELYHQVGSTMRRGAGISCSCGQSLVAVHFSKEGGSWKALAVNIYTRWVVGALTSEGGFVGHQQSVLHVISQNFCFSFLFQKEFRYLLYVGLCAGYMVMKDTVFSLRK